MTPLDRPSLTSTQFKNFADFIYDISGIRFQEAKNYFLASKLDMRKKDLNMSSLDEYYNFITKQPKMSREIELLLNEITINETFFYRNTAQLDSYNKDILMDIIAQKRAKGDKRLRIWSAASSTGDEAYTLIMDMLEKNLHREFTIEIVGTDISQKALSVAKEGVYKKYAIRNIPPHLLRKHFTILDEHNYKLSDEIKRYGTFKHCNLSDAMNCRALGKFDIVFCRNVLIYFDRESREQVLTNIYNNMNDNAFLLVGHSENLYAERHLFEICKDKLQALAYKKAPKGTEKARV